MAPEAVPAAPLRANLAGVTARLGDPVRAESELARALATSEPDRDPANAALVYRQLGRLRVAAGAADEGAGALATAATLFERAGFGDEVATCRLERGQALLAAGDPRHAVAEFSRAQGLFAREATRSRRHEEGVVAALDGLAACYDALAQPATAATFRKRADALREASRTAPERRDR